MSFSCPHYDFANDGACTRLNRPCVPGRPGCVLRRNSQFLVPAEERIEEQPRQPEPKPREQGRRRSGPF